MQQETGLTRQMGLLGLAATGICSMLGAAINVIPFSIQRTIPGIGPHVLAAYLVAAVPAALAALAYAILASAMPRAGGSYVYASRAIGPYWGFAASFSQWFGLSIAIGVVAYLLIPFLRDAASTAGWTEGAALLETGAIRVALALAFLWTFVGINLRGIPLYVATLVPLMILMFALGGVVIVAGFWFDQNDFTRAVMASGVTLPAEADPPPLTLPGFLAATTLLFSSFIGFDSIAQAGGEARNPERSLPLAIAIAIVTVGSFYLLFTGAVYHAVPWTYVAAQAAERDVTAPGLLGYLLPPAATAAILLGAAVALINDLPAMLLAVSRLMFAWGEDGVFPKAVARVHDRWHTPHVAILASGVTASLGILGSHLAGDFFLGVDILVTAMLVNFILMALSVLLLPRRNPAIAARAKVLAGRRLRTPLMLSCTAMLAVLLGVHTFRDLSGAEAWYLSSTVIWTAVMALATLLYGIETRRLRRSGVDLRAVFSTLPPE
ncbi:Arginine/agmatine antiporter [bacterium HR33]|nr:Arginine/agmatine antiporter [bacterium HR33]